jgi:hypothetical protein
MLVDVSTPAWQLQYTNDAFTVASGVWRGVMRRCRT